MQFTLIAVRGKVTEGGEKISKYIKSLDGTYTVDINLENTLATPKNCRDAYFFKVDLVRDATGNERYDIHNEFKQYSKIASTKDFTVVDWRNFIKNFQVYIFENLDIVV